MRDAPPAFAVYETERLLPALEEYGCAIVRRAVTPELVAAARAAIGRLTPGYWDATGANDHYKNVFNRDPFWLRFLDRPGLIELAEAALGADCHIIGETAWRSHPGYRPPEGLHVDYLPMEVPEALFAQGLRVPMFICTAHFYLDDIDAALAPTCVIPGSHRAGRRPRPGETDWHGVAPVPVPCDAGDALVFRSDLWHCGSENRAARPRHLLQVHYARREMAQHFAPYLDWRFDPAVLAAATRRQKRLLGDHDPGPFD